MSAIYNWTQIFSQVLNAGDTSGTVTFPVQFFTVPTNINIGVIYPNSTATSIVINRTSLSTTGFAFTIAPAVPASGYILTGAATAVQPTPQYPCGCSGGSGFAAPTVQYALWPIGNGVIQFTVTFPIPFTSTPTSVVASVVKADGSMTNYFPTTYAYTKYGFSVELQAPTDAATYSLSYAAYQ